MSSVLGVSVGAGAIRVARPHTGNSAERFVPDRFDLQSAAVGDQQLEEVAADTVGALLAAVPGIAGTAIAYRGEQHAHAVRAAMARRQLTNYELVPEVAAAVQFLHATGELQGYTNIAVYDLGAAGLSVSVVDVVSREVCHSERTSDIGGDYIDALIREQQIAAGRIAHPPDPAGLVALDALCRQAKEQLTANTAVALPSEHGLVLISQENFEALIMLAVESSARMTRDVIMRSKRAAQAVVLIGGGARIPLVARVMERWIGMPVLVPAQPETVVARGAALLARPSARPAVPPRAPAAPSPSAVDMSVARTEILRRVAAPSAPRDESPTVVRRSGLVARGRAAARPSKTPGSKGHRRELSVAGVAVGALVVVAALGLGLGWGPAVLQGDSQSSNKSTAAPVTTTTPPKTTAVRPPVVVPLPIDTTNASVAVPTVSAPPTTTDAAPPPPGPNTFTVVPGLPPIVLPMLPPVVLPQFPGPR